MKDIDMVIDIGDFLVRREFFGHHQKNFYISWLHDIFYVLAWIGDCLNVNFSVCWHNRGVRMAYPCGVGKVEVAAPSQKGQLFTRKLRGLMVLWLSLTFLLYHFDLFWQLWKILQGKLAEKNSRKKVKNFATSPPTCKFMATPGS